MIPLQRIGRSSWEGTHMTSPRPKKILIVEDEPDIAELVRHYLEKEGFHLSIARTGLEALTLAASTHPDLVILDLMLPQMDGFEVCKTFRQKPETALLPIIMLTAKKDESDTVVGLELGADDYVTKPFSPKALVARIKSLFRRVERAKDPKSAALTYGSLQLDLSRHEVSVNGTEVPLTAKEFGLLEHLLRHPGRVLTREVLLNEVWGYDYYGTTRTVDVHIRRLKVKMPILSDAIISIKTLGYKLLDHPQIH